jgi:hypothetical protein
MTCSCETHPNKIVQSVLSRPQPLAKDLGLDRRATSMACLSAAGLSVGRQSDTSLFACLLVCVVWRLAEVPHQTIKMSRKCRQKRRKKIETKKQNAKSNGSFMKISAKESNTNKHYKSTCLYWVRGGEAPQLGTMVQVPVYVF